MIRTTKPTSYNLSNYRLFQERLLERGFQYIGSGSFRDVYIRGNIVIKVPKNQEGFDDNLSEAYAYRKYRNSPDKHDVVYAPSRLLSNGCLMMVRVNHVPSNDLPRWAYWLDAAQAGEYKGRIVGYDTACDIHMNDREEALDYYGMI